MKRAAPLLILLISMILISCNPLKGFSLNPITELYSGKISIAKGIRASTSEGKENYLKLIIEDNTIVATGWLLPEAMADNCAMLFVNENPQTFDEVDVLEIEIINTTSNSFQYRKPELDHEAWDYKKVERVLDNFVNTLEANKIDQAVAFMKSGPNTNLNDWVPFLKTVKGVLPAKYKGTKLIGYRQIRQSEKTYEVDFVVISQDDVKRMIKATLEEDKNELRFSSITI